MFPNRGTLLHLLGVVLFFSTVDIFVVLPGTSAAKMLMVVFLLIASIVFVKRTYKRGSLRIAIPSYLIYTGFLFFMFFCLAALRLHASSRGVSVLFSYFNLSVLAATITILPRHRRDISTLVRYVLAGVVLLTIAAPISLFTINQYRAYPLGMNPNLAGITFVLGLVLLGAFVDPLRSRTNKRLFVVGAFAFLLALGLTESRESFIGFAVTAAVLLFLVLVFDGRIDIRRLVPETPYLIGGFALFLLITMLVPTFWEYVERFTSPIRFLLGQGSVEYQNLRTLVVRLNLYKVGLEMIREAPLLGHGLGTFHTYTANHPLVGRPKGAHSTYIFIASQLGLVGLGLFLGFLLSLFESLRRAILLAGDNERTTLLFLTAGVVGGFAVGIGTDVLRIKLLWIVVGFGLALFRLLATDIDDDVPGVPEMEPGQ